MAMAEPMARCYDHRQHARALVCSQRRPEALAMAVLLPAIFLAILLGAPKPAAACSCWHPSVEEHLQSANVIFTGVVTAITEVEPGAGRIGRSAIFDVETQWKGSPGKRAEVSYDQSDGANCGWEFEPGQRVTVFAAGTNGRLSTGMCQMIPYTRRGMRADYDFALEIFRSQWLALAARAQARPSDPLAQLGLAVFLEEANDLDGAGQAYAAAVAAAPDERRGHAGRGRVLFAMRQFNAAIEPLTRAAGLAPDDAEVRRLLGQARAKAGDLTDLALMDFRGFEMNNVNLSGAQMRGRDFSESRLNRSNFSGATLAGARFIDANLHHPNFANADLRMSQLDRLRSYKADLTGADLTHARLVETILFHAVLQGANLTRVNGQKANFESATTVGARFDGANLSGASFRAAHAADTDFADANLEGADFRDADLSGANLSDASVYGARFDNAHYDCRTKLPEGFDPDPWPMIAVQPSCDGRPMNRDFSGMELVGTDFSGLDLRGANFRGATFGPGVRFWGADLRSADFSHSRGADDFRNADLSGADFTGAQDVGSFYGVGQNEQPAILKGTKFRGVRLQLGNFMAGRDSRPADLAAADLEGAIFDCRAWERQSPSSPWWESTRQAYIALLKDIDPETRGFTVEGKCPQ